MLVYGTVGAAAVIGTVLGLFGARTPPEPLRTFPVSGHALLGKAGQGAQIVLFVDYNCPACKDFERTHLPDITRELIRTGMAHLYLFQSPFLAESSMAMAGAAECALQQNQAAFWRYHRLLMARSAPEGAPAPVTELRALAQRAKLDVTRWNTCYDRGEGLRQAQLDLQTHKDVNMQGTPTVFVNGRRTPAGGLEIAQAITAPAASQENRP